MKAIQANRVLTLLMAMVVTGLVFQAQSHAQWEKVTYRQKAFSPSLQTECATNHQGKHVVTEARASLKDGVLSIRFPAQLPGYWGYMAIEVNQGLFQAKPGGVPFVRGMPTYQVRTQKLILAKKNYRVGDTLNGYIDIRYNEIDHYTQETHTFYFKGGFSTMVRAENFQAHADENIKTYDLLTALHELGSPLYARTLSLGADKHTLKEKMMDYPPFGELGQSTEFQTQALIPVRAELLKTGKQRTISELTWDISPGAELSDSGRERLTIWYSHKNRHGLPLRYKKWIETEND